MERFATLHSSVTYFAVQIDDWTDANELGTRVLLENREENVRDQVNAFLYRPAANENEQLRVWINFKTGPLLSLPSQGASFGFNVFLNEDFLGFRQLLVPWSCITRIGIG